MAKPHLKRANGYWQCIGQGRTGYGLTPRSAWNQWWAMRPDRKPGKLPPRPLPALTQAQRLALENWEPGQAH